MKVGDFVRIKTSDDIGLLASIDEVGIFEVIMLTGSKIYAGKDYFEALE